MFKFNCMNNSPSYKLKKIRILNIRVVTIFYRTIKYVVNNLNTSNGYHNVISNIIPKIKVLENISSNYIRNKIFRSSRIIIYEKKNHPSFTCNSKGNKKQIPYIVQLRISLKDQIHYFVDQVLNFANPKKRNIFFLENASNKINSKNNKLMRTT